MAKEAQTQAGRCATHGPVQAAREVLEMGTVPDHRSDHWLLI